MTEYDKRFAVAVGLAGIAGGLHGVEPSIPLLVDQPILSLEPSPAEISPILSLMNLLSTTVTVGIFLGGYWWARRADVPAAYGRFAVSLFVAAIVGHSVGFLPLFLLLSEQPVVTALALFGTLAVSLISVPVPGLAGGAIAQYRSVEDPT
jgi:hypothetical protein